MRLRLYHGTAHDFPAFDDRYVMRGTEPNSALGIHLTEHPVVAAEYAELAGRDRHATAPRVLVLDVEISKAAIISSVEDFLGRPEDVPYGHEGNRTREEFVAARQEFQAQGYEALALDTEIEDLRGAWVVFDPEKIEIVGSVSVEDAYGLGDGDLDWSGVQMVSARLFDDTLMAIRRP